MSERDKKPVVKHTVLDDSIENLLSIFVGADSDLQAASDAVTKANNAFSNVKNELTRSLKARAVLVGEEMDSVDLSRVIDKMTRRVRNGESPWL